MTRRNLILEFLPRKKDKIKYYDPPTDPEQVNKFGDLYNSYIASLRDGILASKVWQQAVRAFKHLIHEE